MDLAGRHHPASGDVGLRAPKRCLDGVKGAQRMCVVIHRSYIIHRDSDCQNPIAPAGAAPVWPAETLNPAPAWPIDRRFARPVGIGGAISLEGRLP